MSKQYFTSDFIKFLKELQKNNNRDWFHANKDDYLKYVKLAFESFISDLIKATGNHDLPVKNAIFRINRDIRFSKDKSPYKTHLAAAVSPTGRKNMQYPGTYLHFESNQIMIAGGCYMPDKANLQKIRQFIIYHHADAQKILNQKSFKDFFGSSVLDGEKNKILPKEFKPYAEDFPLIFNKQYFFTNQHADTNILVSDQLMDFVMKRVNAGKKWNEFLIKAMEI